MLRRDAWRLLFVAGCHVVRLQYAAEKLVRLFSTDTVLTNANYFLACATLNGARFIGRLRLAVETR
ncbi:hypothetical protein WS86_00110 (plasmid) [Burkholderia savannae]|uniref:Uncharacterized protein n=1 Tax=Burkholderia savannae TaxID=1637837 RepID=A0ABR5TBK0_9BURK|nr:hypothetical protein WS86_00110 [Burkholderia savannae]KWZ39578.1 hypothetical protein WS72_19435 [Burkholderia savannae]